MCDRMREQLLPGRGAFRPCSGGRVSISNGSGTRSRPGAGPAHALLPLLLMPACMRAVARYKTKDKLRKALRSGAPPHASRLRRAAAHACSKRSQIKLPGARRQAGSGPAWPCILMCCMQHRERPQELCAVLTPHREVKARAARQACIPPANKPRLTRLLRVHGR